MATAAPPQWDAMPDACKELRHWVLWKTEMRDDRLTKVPIRADSGFKAESDNQTTWTTFEKVREAFEKGRGLGAGFVFARSSEISGVDLDHCRDPVDGAIDAWAQAYIDRLNSYTEISPSGTGLHGRMQPLRCTQRRDSSR
jgi:putative DNA primase/helicase